MPNFSSSFPPSTIVSPHTVPNRRIYCFWWPWFVLWTIHTHTHTHTHMHTHTHTQSTLIRVLSGNYSDVCLLLVIVQGKEKVNCGLWVIDWKQGIIRQRSHWPEIQQLYKHICFHHRFFAHVLLWKHKALLITFSNWSSAWWLQTYHCL